MRTITARQLLNYLRAGLILCGISEDGYEWMGEKKNWNVFTWLEDGAYEDLPDNGQTLIKTYLCQN